MKTKIKVWIQLLKKWIVNLLISDYYRKLEEYNLRYYDYINTLVMKPNSFEAEEIKVTWKLRRNIENALWFGNDKRISK